MRSRLRQLRLHLLRLLRSRQRRGLRADQDHAADQGREYRGQELDQIPEAFGDQVGDPSFEVPDVIADGDPRKAATTASIVMDGAQ